MLNMLYLIVEQDYVNSFKRKSISNYYYILRERRVIPGKQVLCTWFSVWYSVESQSGEYVSGNMLSQIEGRKESNKEKRKKK